MDDLASLRRVDRHVLATLRRHGEMGRAELLLASNLARSTMVDALGRLRGCGMITERASKEQTAGERGRPRSMVSVARGAGVIAAVTLTWDSVQAAIMGFDGEILVARNFAEAVPSMSHGVAAPVERLIQEVLLEAGLTNSAVVCAVLGVPTAVRPDTGVLSQRMPVPIDRPGRWRPPTPPPQLEGDPAGELRERMNLPVWVENDANLGAMGEATFGAGREFHDFVYLKIASGIGAGIVFDGKVHRGVSGRAGELAHLHVLDDGPVCVCGNRGCLATAFNSPRLVDLVQAAHTHPLTLEDVHALAVAGDPGVTRVLIDLGRTLGRSLADFCVYVNLHGIVLESVLGASSDAVIAGIRESIERRTSPSVAADVRLVAGTLGSRAELMGAVALARQRYADLEQMARP